MPDFLAPWIHGTSTEAHKNWVAKALVGAFPDPAIFGEFTYARMLLAPIYDELLSRARQCEGQRFDPEGLRRSEPLLVLAAHIAAHGFGMADGADGRRLLFQAIVEVIAFRPANAKAKSLVQVAHALRIELEALQANVHSRPPNPDFSSVWEAIPWFGQQLERYSDDATRAWRNDVSKELRAALLNPAPLPGAGAEEDEELGGQVVDIAPSGYDSEQDEDGRDLGIPPGYWLTPEDDIGPGAGWDEAVRKEVLGASISTYIPLGRFTPASPTYLVDERAAEEARELMADAIRSRENKDVALQKRSLAKALSLASATPVTHLGRLLWGTPSADGVRQYPGLLSPCARWLYRPELTLGDSKLVRDGWVHIPLPAALSKELLALGTNLGDRPLVFPVEGGPIHGSDRVRSGSRATLTQLQRALVCRLVTNGRWGPSLAQYVAGDDLGIDLAPLHYDKISAADMVVAVSRVSSAWFGEPPGRIEGSLPGHFVGSRRVPNAAIIKSALAGIRELWEASPKTLVCRITHRTRNLVHGLFLTTGHRPNEKFAELARRNIGQDDRIAIILDKAVGPDWAKRPVALDERWIAEFQTLLGDLEAAATDHPESALGQAALKALEGDGPIFLVADSMEQVRAFCLEDYKAGLPADLLEIENFARQFLNYELSKLLPEPLRVAQMGWHGTRAGAFSDGSPWSVREACAQISPVLDRVLKSVGWRPLDKPMAMRVRPMSPVSWKGMEADHRATFRKDLEKRKSAAAARRAEAVAAMATKLPLLLASEDPGLSIGLSFDGKALQKVPGQADPVIIPAKWSEELIRRLSGGDPRCLEAHAARGWLRDLVLDGRERQVLNGAVPRRSHERWPVDAGPFLLSSPVALYFGRRLDESISGSVASRSLKTVVTLLLHGGYADLSAVLSAMAPGSRLSRLESMPACLLVEPPDQDMDDGPTTLEPVAAWTHGTMAFHGLAALALSSWHESRPSCINPVEIDAELAQRVDGELCSEKQAGGVLPWLTELEALARAINSLRMDGVARLVGTGKVRPASASIQRIVELRDNLPVGPRSEVFFRELAIHRGSSKRDKATQTANLIDELTTALSKAVDDYEKDRGQEARIRSDLEAKLRGWVGMEPTYQPEHLVALYALLLLTRGGRRRSRLELTTIRGYVYSVARPLVATLPSSPMQADSDAWKHAFLAALAMAEPAERPGRADGLANFHWVLSQAMAMPSVDFGEIFAFAGRSSYIADAGFLTNAELRSLAWALDADVESARSSGSNRVDIHEAILTRRLARIAYAGALRPGEAAALSYRNLPSVQDDRLGITKNKFQALKNLNARRLTRLVAGEFGATAIELVGLGTMTRQQMGSKFRLGLPVLSEPNDPTSRQEERSLLDRLSKRIKWSTGELDASPYWLRKAAIHGRVERFMDDGRGSLWPLRRLLAEIGHAEIRVTLASYMHDPVTPFLRWFGQAWTSVDAGRIADAADRALDVVSRRRGGLRLASSPARIEMRLAELLKGAPYLGEVEAKGYIALPTSKAPAREGGASVTAQEVSEALDVLATGRLEVTDAMEDWPSIRKKRFLEAVTQLEREHGIRFTAYTPLEESAAIQVIPPRRLSDDGGIWSLLGEAEAQPVLVELFEVWVRGLDYAVAQEKIVASPSDWARWFEAAPKLDGLGWEISPYGRGREAGSLPSRGGRRPGLWPTLKWVMACAFLHSRTNANDGESPSGGSAA